jgi:asparagine synthase (glutamine-hydrolysing)
LVEQEYDISNWMTRSMLLDINYCLPDDYLTKVDRATMKYSLEARCPLLDVRLMEYALKIPTSMKYKHATLKFLLRDIAYDYIPRELLDRPKKGFEVPMEKWLKGPLKEKLLEYTSAEFLKKQDLFDADKVAELMQYYLNNDDKGRMTGKNFTNLVWAYFVFQMWYQYYCV